MYVIGITNNKGGGTKTTIANNLTIYFRENGLNVLLIDFDPQANTSSLYNPKIDNSTYDLLNGVPIEECIENDLIKADESVALLEQMVSQGGYAAYLAHGGYQPAQYQFIGQREAHHQGIGEDCAGPSHRRPQYTLLYCGVGHDEYRGSGIPQRQPL